MDIRRPTAPPRGTLARSAGYAAWIDAAGAEIGDKCAWSYATTGTKKTLQYVKQSIGGYNWVLQQEWSNATSSCQ